MKGSALDCLSELLSVVPVLLHYQQLAAAGAQAASSATMWGFVTPIG